MSSNNGYHTNGSVAQNTVLADALHNATADVLSIKPRKEGKPPTKKQLKQFRRRVEYGKGVVVGIVAGLMHCGFSFDDAWRLCLSTKPDISNLCISEGWPTAGDYAEFDRHIEESEA